MGLSLVRLVPLSGLSLEVQPVLLLVLISMIHSARYRLLIEPFSTRSHNGFYAIVQNTCGHYWHKFNPVIYLSQHANDVVTAILGYLPVYFSGSRCVHFSGRPQQRGGDMLDGDHVFAYHHINSINKNLFQSYLIKLISWF